MKGWENRSSQAQVDEAADAGQNRESETDHSPKECALFTVALVLLEAFRQFLLVLSKPLSLLFCLLKHVTLEIVQRRILFDTLDVLLHG